MYREVKRYAYCQWVSWPEFEDLVSDKWNDLNIQLQVLTFTLLGAVN